MVHCWMYGGQTVAVVSFKWWRYEKIEDKEIGFSFYCLFDGCLTLGDLEEVLASSLECLLSSSLLAEVPELTATAIVPAVRRLIFERFAGKLSLRLSC